MKKITFVEKQDESSYDPVNTFFAKKNHISTPKPEKNLSRTVNSSVKKPIQTKTIQKSFPNKPKPPLQQKPMIFQHQIVEKYQEQSIKTVLQQNNQNDQIIKKQVPKKQIITTSNKRLPSTLKEQINKVNNTNQRKPPIPQITQKQVKQAKLITKKQTKNINNGSKQIDKESQTIVHNIEQAKNNKPSIQINQIKQKLTSSQQQIKQYLQKIQSLQSRIQSLIKCEQKLSKLQKQHKLCVNQTKQIIELKQCLSQKQLEVKNLLLKQQIPYNKKRQYLLTNKINELKKQNQILVLRIKSYKGSDLVQMAINSNKHQIMRQFQIQHQSPDKLLHVQIQSLIRQLIHQIQIYLNHKTNHKLNQKINLSKQYSNNTTLQNNFQKQQMFLLQINKIAQKISLNYLQKFQVAPLPKCNQDAINIYAQIQKYKNNPQFLNLSKSYADKQDLNFVITQANLQIINDLQQNSGQMELLKEQFQKTMSKQNKSKQKSVSTRPTTSNALSSKKPIKKQEIYKKLIDLFQIYKKRSNISTIFHIQSLCYLAFYKESLQKKLKSLQSQLVNLYGQLKELKQIYDIGGNMAKQSLYAYLQANIQNFIYKVPNLQIKVKQIASVYKLIIDKTSR